MKTIGFFGDSYCAINDRTDKFDKDYTWLTTYISLVSEKYGLEVVNLGVPGSSLYDCLLLQFESFLKNNQLPDICVFVWTDPHRLFHRKIRCINFGTAQQSKHLGNEWKAAYFYYKELHDFRLAKLQYVAMMHYYDNVILPQVTDKTKIIHLWGSGELEDTSKYHNHKPIDPKDVAYAYRWKTGTEIRPSLSTLSDTFFDPAPNHIGTQEKNNVACEWISTAIDNYENGKLLEF